MKKMDSRKEIHVIIDRLPDECLLAVRDMLKTLLRYTGEHFSSPALIEPLEDESQLKPDFLKELRTSEEAVRNGDTITLEEYLKESAKWK